MFINMGKTIIRLTESELHKIVYETVYRILEQKQNINEGWKNYAMAGALGAATLFGNPQAANAQNYVFNSIKDPNEVTGQKIDKLLLDANKPIRYNYDLIKQRMSLHREKNYAEYTIWCKGHYTNKKGKASNDVDVYMINIKGKDNERYFTIEGQIIRALTTLYAQSLDEPFDVSPDEFQRCVGGADYGTYSVPVYTINTNSGISGGVYRKGRGPSHLVFGLSEYSPTWLKIYNKVIEETGLKDGGEMYEMDFKMGLIDGIDRTFDDGIPTTAEIMPQFPGGDTALKEYLSEQASSNYPIVARENEVQGRVIVSFIVECDGSITDVKVVKSVDPSLDKAAQRLVKNMPHWIPAKQNGSAIRCKNTVTVPFVLDK